jgi:signal transduction histidine kinase
MSDDPSIESTLLIKPAVSSGFGVAGSPPLIVEQRTGLERRVAERGLLHDLHDSVAAIRVLSAAAMLNGGLPPAVGRQLRAIGVEAERLALLCDRRLGASPAPVPCRLDVVARKVIRSRQHVFDCRIEWQGSRVQVAMDSTSTWRVLVNLLGNACRAAGPGGLVRVVIEPEPSLGTVRLHVDDDGPGPGLGPRGAHGLGLEVVSDLLRANGGGFTLGPGPLGGARASAAFLCVPESGAGRHLAALAH